MADQLISITQLKGLDFILPRNVITWEARGLKNTIDLVFLSERLLGTLTECEVRKDLHHRSDHYPIVTYLNLTPDTEPEIRKRAWKSADSDKVLQAVKELRFDLPTLANEANIDAYVTQITYTLQEVEEKTVLWAKPSSKAWLFWTSKCGKLTRVAKKL